jgi:hypothetical protein
MYMCLVLGTRIDTYFCWARICPRAVAFRFRWKACFGPQKATSFLAVSTCFLSGPRPQSKDVGPSTELFLVGSPVAYAPGSPATGACDRLNISADSFDRACRLLIPVSSLT